MLKLKFVAVFFLLLELNKNGVVFGMSLWDQVVKKEHVYLTVEYEERYLNVWRQDSHGYSKFYVTPLCIMEVDSIECSRDEFSNLHRHAFEFNVKLWDLKAAKVVQNALKQKNVDAPLSDILPLPMQQVRIGLGGKDLVVEADDQWRSNQDQPHVMAFELYTRHEHVCNKMISDAKNNTQHFLRRFKPYFEFTMVVGQHETRNFKLTGKFLQNSSFYSELVNKYADEENGIVYLQSKDLNRLTRDLYNKISFNEEVSAAYISSPQEKEIINELLDIFKEKQIQSTDLTKDEWNSVFWDDIFSRPDIQTEYANEVLKYDEKEKSFIYDSDKDTKFRGKINRNNQKKEEEETFNWFGEAFARGKDANKNEKNSQNAEKIGEQNTVSFDDFNKTIQNENIHVKWTGMKFEQKNLTLYRINTKTLNTSNEIFFKRVIVTKYQTTQKIEIKPSHSLGYMKSYTDPNLRYSFHTKKLSFIGAEGYCFGLNGHLVTVNSMYENMFLSEKILSAFTDNTSNSFWIGATDTIKAPTWSWVDKSTLSFNNWDIDQPKNNSEKRCGAMLMHGGKWITEDCNEIKPFVCQFKDDAIFAKPFSSICPESWTYYSSTGFCYKSFRSNTSWYDSEMLCAKQQAHLASIHSFNENLFVTYLANISTFSCAGSSQAWIGSSRINDKPFTWTDGSPVHYTSWARDYPLNNTSNCINLWIGKFCFGADFSVGPTQWRNMPCNLKVENVICKKASNI